MKQYEVIAVPNISRAQEAMDEMAAKGWRVVAVTHWGSLLITFEREAPC